MTPLDDLREMLGVLANHWGHRPGFEYRGPYDFVLRHGAAFETRPLPDEYEYGAPKACFGNAIYVAETRGIAYVEGYALVSGIPIHHAWNADDGGLVDVTWRSEKDGRRIPMPGAAYLGVAFSVERADDATWNGDASILDDYLRRWPILRRPWQGETDEEYPASPLLDALRSPDPRAAMLALRDAEDPDDPALRMALG